jgi:predicted NBD/HSP70 family sugar kinase
LAHATGLSQATISNIVASSCREGLVTIRYETNGRRFKIVSLSQNLGLGLGIGIDHHQIDVVVGDLGSGVLQSRRAAIAAGESPSAILGEAAELSEEALEANENTVADVVAAGLSLPSPIYERLDSTWGEPAFPSWWFAQPVDWLQRRIGAPVFLDNDANAATLAEWRWGAGRGINDLVVVQLGEGIGSGLILGGRLYHGGLGGAAGELGHIIVEPQGPRCRCGNEGCLESVASLRAIVRDAGSAAVDIVDTPSLMHAVRAGDPDGVMAVSRASERIGRVLAIVANLLSPSRIVVGGPMMQIDRVVLPHMRRGMEAGLMQNVLYQPELVASELDESSRALGALALAARSVPDETLAAHLHP